jgi:DNA-binding transcriptional LysR family regulator
MLEVEAGLSRDLIPALKEGRLDLGLVGLPGDVSSLDVRDVHASPLVAALPARHRLAKRKRLSLLEVDDLPLFWIPRSHNPGYHDFCLRHFRALGYRPEMIVVEPGQVQTLERIAQGEGWTMLNGAMLDTRVPGIAYRPLAEGEALAIRIVAAWRPGQDEDRCRLLAEAAAGVLRAAPAGQRRAKPLT